MTLKFAGAFFLAIAAARAGLIPTVQVLQGPGSKTTLIGPDGSALSSSSPGGTVVTNGATGLVAAGPAILGSSPQIVVAGPAGSIATVNTLAGPAVVPAAHAVAVAPSGVPVGDANDAEGAYVADNTELLYDDGSYKGER